MGLSGPNVPMSNWEPRGANGRFQQDIAKFLDYGEAPDEHGHISLKSVDFIQYQYMCPPINDQSDLLLMPEMAVFTVNELDAEEDSTLVLSVPKLNKLMQDQYDDFQLAHQVGINGTVKDPTNPHFDNDCNDFQRFLEEFGERGLEDYAYAVSHKQDERIRQMDSLKPDLKRFWHLSTSSEFCWLTRYGIMQRISFSGRKKASLALIF